MKHLPTTAWRRTAAAGAVFAAFTAQPALAQTWTLYEDFSSTNLSSSRWNGEDGRTSGGNRLDERRAIVDGQLRLESRGAGDTQRNSGSNSFRNTLTFARSGAVTAMKATITVRSAKLNHCAANTANSSGVRARLMGFFFNAGTPQPGSLYNDVGAQVTLFRVSNTTDAPDTFRVNASVFQCNDENCVSSVGIPGGADILTGVPLNQPVEVSVVWDKANNQFKFTANAATLTVPYTMPDSAPASYGAKRIELNNFAQQCTDGRIVVSNSADFDNIYTNPEALP